MLEIGAAALDSAWQLAGEEPNFRSFRYRLTFEYKMCTSTNLSRDFGLPRQVFGQPRQTESGERLFCFPGYKPGQRPGQKGVAAGESEHPLRC